MLARVMLCVCMGACVGVGREETIDVVDLTQPTTVPRMTGYYAALDNKWKGCVSCGAPGLGTTMHLEQEAAASQAVVPALVPPEYLLARLEIIDVVSLARLQPTLALPAAAARQWEALRRDPPEPTLLLFKFGWQPPPPHITTCSCNIPGLSSELAEWIVANLTHVVGVGSDAPSLEPHPAPHPAPAARSVAAVLARSGLYMIENVRLRATLPESGCMSIAMPLKLQHANYVPCRLMAACGGAGGGARRVVLAVRGAGGAGGAGGASRVSDVDMDDILNN